VTEGYVPVYIRHGDTPLQEINPELAVAFHETGISSRSRKDKSASEDQIMFADQPASNPSSGDTLSKKTNEQKENVESDVLDIEKFEKKFGSNENRKKESEESNSSESDESSENKSSGSKSDAKANSNSKQSEIASSNARHSSVKYNTPTGTDPPLTLSESTPSVSPSIAG